MSEQLSSNPSHLGIPGDAASSYMPEEPHCYMRKWYFSKKEIEDHSPSRKDGIDLKKESELRKLYCSYLRELGVKLKVPQVTIASALMLCHRFYLRQSLAKNDWQTIATASMFLACKIEETPRLLREVVVVAYEMIYKWDPSASKRIRQKEIFDKQKELILTGERFLLETIAFDLNIQHPYKPLVDAVKRMGISNNHLVKVAWNFVNDWLFTTLCLQYKPHCIAAGSLFLAAKFLKVKLPSEKGKVWWLQFEVAPKQLDEVIRHMQWFLGWNRKQAPSPTQARVSESMAVPGNPMSHCPQTCAVASKSSCVTNSGKTLVTESSLNVASSKSHCAVEVAVQHQNSGSSSANSVVEDLDGEIHSRTRESEQNLSCKIDSVHVEDNEINVNLNRETSKRRCSTDAKKKSAVARDDQKCIEAQMNSDPRKRKRTRT